MKLHAITTSAALLALLTTPAASIAGTSFEQAKKAATTEIDNAKAAGFEWRDSRKILKKAEEAEKAGKHSDAMKLANQAKKQGIDAVAQAKVQVNAGPH
jgi:hypothetical protein